MNVRSLTSNQDKDRSVEMKIAKVAFTIFFLFILAWTPYTVVSLITTFGNRFVRYRYMRYYILETILYN